MANTLISFIVLAACPPGMAALAGGGAIWLSARRRSSPWAGTAEQLVRSTA
jgi:hypothetical protein